MHVVPISAQSVWICLSTVELISASAALTDIQLWNTESGFRPGVALNLSEKFSLVAHVGFLGYQGGNRPAKNNGAPENWGLDLSSNNLMFGFYYHF